MNKHLVLFVLSTCFSAAFLNGQTGEKKGWPSKERYSFIEACINTAKKSMSNDSARFYCFCMQEKLEIKYPDTSDAFKITADEMATPEWKKEVRNCLVGTWTKANRDEFLNSCTNAAKEGLGADKAKNYCECMLFKMEKIYPNPDDAAKVSSEDLKTDYWKNLIKSCIDF